MVVCENDMAEGRVDDGFHMAFLGTCEWPLTHDSMSGLGIVFFGLLPIPAAGRTLTSMAASSGSSSLLCTSMGPLTAAMTVYPPDEYVAEPSALCSSDS